jgi:dihydrofolate synthase/folylpolyglutamate synthase
LSAADRVKPGTDIDPDSPAIFVRLRALYPILIDLSPDRLLRLLSQLGDPQDHLPPVIHVAGTNGKGSTCAFLRAMGEAAGWRVHVYTSPHLVRFNERIRIAGELVSDADLWATLHEVERVNAGAPITVFEVLVAAAFLLFSRVPADLCVVEVGLGGRGDATNVLRHPRACAIASISMDHREYLGDTLTLIAREKAGIMKPGVPVVTGHQPAEVMTALEAVAHDVGSRLLVRGRDWEIAPAAAGLRYSDESGSLDVPPPSLLGVHQHDNAGIALASLRASGLAIEGSALAAGVGKAEWPARMQRLKGALTQLVPPDWEIWLDGGHNPGGGVILAEHMASWAGRSVHLIAGMKQSKDAAEFLRPLLPLAATVWAIAEPEQHLALPVEAIVAASGGVARIGPTLREALAKLPRDGGPSRVLVCGSLYLAGEVLKLETA